MCQNNYSLFYPALQTNLSGDVPVFGQTVLHVFVWDWVSFVYNVYLILFYILNVAQRVLLFNLFYCLLAVQLLSTGFPNALYQLCENICLHQSIIYFSSGVNIQ